MNPSAASVRDRLRNLVREHPQAFQAVLVRYGIERLLVRLTASRHADRFVLKGAQLLLVHQGAPHRPTKDLDLLGLGSDDADELAAVFRDVCSTSVPDDGLAFHAASVTTEPIRESARYGGVRVRLLATVVAEKLESLVSLGLATSRMKDLYDLWHIARTFTLPHHEVRRAIEATFHRRGTRLDTTPEALTDAFWKDSSKRTQWRAFLTRNELGDVDLETVVQEVAAALEPILRG